MLFETGQPDQAIELLLSRAGGEELTLIPSGWRAHWLELLTRCWLALDRPSDAGRAAAALGACGAWRYRQSAERELGNLGHRPHRRTRPGTANAAGIKSLTGRELQVARLVDRKTNPQIAAEPFLSQKTIETHLRNIFHKMGITTRTALARAVERTDPAPSPRRR